jgi:hypothetical protein
MVASEGSHDEGHRMSVPARHRGHGVVVDVASAYSVRPTPDARVSTPLAWSEVPDCRPEAFTLPAMLERWASTGDPWAPMDDAARSLEPLLELAAQLGPAEKPPKGIGRRTMPLVEIARAKSDAEALAGLERWKDRHPDVAARLEAANVLVDRMRRSQLALVPNPGQAAARPRGPAARAGTARGRLRPVGRSGVAGRPAPRRLAERVEERVRRPALALDTGDPEPRRGGTLFMTSDALRA